MWQMGCINFIVDLTVISLTQLASRGVSRHLLDPSQQITMGRWVVFFIFGGLRLKPIISPCLCECLTHWIISMINKTSLPGHNVFGSSCDVDPGVSVEGFSHSRSLCFHVLGEFFMFWLSDIVTNNVTNLSLIQMNSCFLHLTPFVLHF